jgi:hypothetical protein
MPLYLSIICVLVVCNARVFVIFVPAPWRLRVRVRLRARAICNVICVRVYIGV